MYQSIILGDNLKILSELKDETIDLCYIDPPFFSNRDYEIISKEDGEIRQFGDRFGDEFTTKNGEKRISKDINKFLAWIEPRIQEIHRILKPTGSFYLHCDEHADAYLRVLCDEIFNSKNFINHIIWCYSGGGASKERFASKHDSILFYAKNKDKKIFNTQYTNYKHPGGKHSGGKSYRAEGKIMDDWWNDIFPVSTSSAERLDFPTQKPEALLERIIQASSNEGDVILDCFCGAGTTLDVAKKLKRDYIGIDIALAHCRLSSWRLHTLNWKNLDATQISNSLNDFKPECYVKNWIRVDTDFEKMKPIDFQNYVSMKLGIIEGKRGADGGIDGIYKGSPVQVKKKNDVGGPDLSKFLGDLLKNKRFNNIKTIYFIALGFKTTFIHEVRKIKQLQNIDVIYKTPNELDDLEKDIKSLQHWIPPQSQLIYKNPKI